jgi:hypothetical protein
VTGEVIPGKLAGTNFTNSLLVGHATTGTLSSAEKNTGVGIDALNSITSGDRNTVVGYSSGTAITSGSFSTFIGHSAGQTFSTGSSNTGVGDSALFTSNANNNTGIGQNSGYHLTGAENTAVGANALQSSAGAGSGARNTAVGQASGTAITSGNNNIFLGQDGGKNITTGSGNVIIGITDAEAVDSARTLKITGNDGSTSTTWIQGDNTGLVTIAGGIVVDNGIDIGIAKLDDGSVTHASSSGVQELDRFVAATYRGGKYVISVSDSANTRFETIELLITHDGTNAYLHSSGVSSSGTSMVTFTTDISDSDVRILMVPISSDSTVYKFVKTLIEV